MSASLVGSEMCIRDRPLMWRRRSLVAYRVGAVAIVSMGSKEACSHGGELRTHSRDRPGLSGAVPEALPAAKRPLSSMS
eukprot:8997926-Alexandrium_andersonii.AAC.1